ncbi:kinase of RNA polymerase II carboxy-terminal domain kinase [Salix suchowensis]|nr:kinase of RNA polymerase II carboxy-terminal domain kinase [Salix suchowensis]
MPSHNRSKRNRNHTKGQDDEHLLATRAAGDDPSYKESYSRRQGDNYRPSSTQSRHYDSDREPLPSRSHPPSWRDADVHDRYEPLSSDPYLRNGRDDYDAVDSRDMDGWVGRGSSESRYERSNEDWSRRYDPSVALLYLRRQIHVLHLLGPEARPARVIEEPLVERDSPTRRRDDGHSGGRQKWKSDNGWDTRREVREQTWSESKPIDPLVEPSPEDRTWEPAPGWQPRSVGIVTTTIVRTTSKAIAAKMATAITVPKARRARGTVIRIHCKSVNANETGVQTTGTLISERVEHHFELRY